MGFFDMHSDDMCERDQQNIRRLNIWWCIWAFSWATALVVLGPDESTEGKVAVWKWVFVGLPLFLSIFAVRAYVKFLKEADELIKRIHLEALALGCGAGIIVGTGFGLLAQVLGHNEDAAALIWLSILLGYTSGLYRASRKYNV